MKAPRLGGTQSVHVLCFHFDVLGLTGVHKAEERNADSFGQILVLPPTLDAFNVLRRRKKRRRRKLRCIASPKTRIGAGLLPQFAEDLIPPELQFPDQKAQERETPAFRPKGAGRPTKRERREIDRLSF